MFRGKYSEITKLVSLRLKICLLEDNVIFTPAPSNEQASQ